MGLDGDPDDYGLPNVDVVIPDDARELERDVIAYQRELRQRRRRERWRRLARPFTRYGIAAPFIASAVLVALISGILMTVISPRPTGQRATQIPPTGPPPYRPGRIGGTLPAGELATDAGRTRLLDMRPAVLAIVPVGCRCDQAIERLSRQAAQLQVQVWLVADGRAGRDADDVRRLAEVAGRRLPKVAEDPGRLLGSTFRTSGLTAVFVHTDGIVREVMASVRVDQDFTRHIEPVLRPGQGALHG